MRLIIGVIFACILSLWAVWPLTGRGYFPMHDDTQVARVIVMGRALKQGQFPVRWVSDLGYGYGYPIYNFYGPLPYYAGGALYAAGFDSVTATKVMFAIGVLLASIFSFLLLESQYGLLGGLIGSVLFTYTPYHAVQVYIRGSVGEYWAIAFIPLLLWGMLLTGNQKRFTRGVIIGSLGLAGVITSHTILGFLTLVMSISGVAVYHVVQFLKHRLKFQSSVYLFSLIGLGLGLSAFFWLPAFLEMSVTGVSSMIIKAPTNFYDHFLCVRQFWDSPWGYGGSAVGCQADGMSFKLGKLHIVLAAVSIAMWIVMEKRKIRIRANSLMMLGVSLLGVSLLGMLDVSGPVWRLVPYVSFIQYPWRLLSFSELALGVCGAFILVLFRGRLIRIIVTLIVLIVCLTINAKLFRPQYMYDRDPRAFETAKELRFFASKVSDEYMPSGIIKPSDPGDIVNTSFKSKTPLSITTLEDKDTVLRAEIESPVSQSVVIQKAYFPGWHYFVNKKEVTPEIALGLPSVMVSEGTSVIELKFTNTSVRLWGNMISLLSVVLFGGVIIYGKKTNA